MPPYRKFIAVSIAVIAVAGLQAAPWWLTQDDIGTDGFQTGGFPLPAVEHGFGIEGFERYLVNFNSLVVDAVFSVVAVWCVTHCLVHLITLGPRRFWTKLRRWGTALDDT